MANSVTRMAISHVEAQHSYLVRLQNCRAIRVHVARIPFFHAEMEPALLIKAAEKARRHGWKNILVLPLDCLCDSYFENDYVSLLGHPLARAQDIHAIYDSSAEFALMDQFGAEPGSDPDIDKQIPVIDYDIDWGEADDETFALLA